MTSVPFAIAVHGGAFQREGDYAPQQEFIRNLLEEARTALAQGKTALDVATDAVCRLEESGLYVAGRGAGPNSAGYYELDAAVMDGATGQAGAVAGLSSFRHPILGARTVMERTPHVLLSGKGAEAFLAAEGLERVDPASWFHPAPVMEAETSHGTVGAVVLDIRGHLVSAVSTGGTRGKREGRVGDPAIIGASIFAGADFAVCSTGHGEFFIRSVAAYDVVARCRYAGAQLDHSVTETLQTKVAASGGWGGMIALSASGEISLRFASRGMHRGSVSGEGDIFVASY
jgi:isoaspartyl peptidase/L-asparaginase-like protein (Ntn-hydrolase superfamily)